MTLRKSFFLLKFIIFGMLVIPLFCPLWGYAQNSRENQKKEEEKVPKITEEILVVAEEPRELPVSTVTKISTTQIEQVKPLDLSEAIRYAPGVTVTFGNKSEYTLKLRGIDSRRIALLIDGIPDYEPYYSSFDLKTVAVRGIDSLQITKGPSSVLYGPNTLGGIVNVITKRPTGRPQLSLDGSFGEKNTRSLGLQYGFQWNRVALAGTVLYQDSEGFCYPDEEGGDRIERTNSEYQRTNINAKLYYNPNHQTEILLKGSIYLAEYAMPPGLDDSRPRYWRFKNWDRYSFNAGGYTALGQDSTLRFRAYYVGYNNTLDMFNDPHLFQLRFESTFDNAVYGLFALSDFSFNHNNQLKVSLNFKGDQARLQDDVGAPWEEFRQSTFSVGIEDHLALFENWKIIGGMSLDYLDKFIGDNTSRINPLVGLKFTPLSELDIHLSFSKKSKFPSMRSMYSGDSGNPDLLSETGTSWEFGLTYDKEVFLSGAAFLTYFKDMIDSVRLPEYDFRRIYFNVGKAHIHGFELQLQKALRWAALTVNYTYLSHKNESEDRPLDALPSHSINFDFQIFPLRLLRIGFLGQAASSSSWLDFNTQELLDIPSYFNLDSVVSYDLGRLEIFLKATNILDSLIYTEPGFPWRGRYFELGFKVNIFSGS
jgi:iron complex outermembrane receptor protein